MSLNDFDASLSNFKTAWEVYRAKGHLEMGNHEWKRPLYTEVTFSMRMAKMDRNFVRRQVERLPLKLPDQEDVSGTPVPTDQLDIEITARTEATRQAIILAQGKTAAYSNLMARTNINPDEMTQSVADMQTSIYAALNIFSSLKHVYRQKFEQDCSTSFLVDSDKVAASRLRELLVGLTSQPGKSLCMMSGPT